MNVIIRAIPCTLVAAISLMTSSPALAGEFSVNCSYSNDNLKNCADKVSDLVTDKFIDKFPATKYQIFVHSNIQSFTDGGFSAYAVAGVIPKGSGQFPVSRFSSTKINGTNTVFSQIELAKLELETMRAAVNNLMERCAISPTCDVYIPRNK